jgi:outer membrane protein assembly factor BamB
VAYDKAGELKWASEVVPGGTGGNWGVVDASPDGSRAAFIAVASRGTGASHRTDVNEYLTSGQGMTLSQDGLGSKGQGRIRFSMDGTRLLVTYPHRHLVRARDAETGRLLWEYGPEDWVAVVSSSRATEIVAIVTRGGILTILSSDGELLMRAQRPNAEVLVAPNGTLLLETAGWLKLSKLELAE